MRLGVVGHGQEKFTPTTESLARLTICQAAKDLGADTLVSGHSPMGGVDIYAEEISKALHLGMIIHAPKRNSWEGFGGYRWRNLRIAEDSDLVLVVVVKELPEGYKGMRFNGCYHCKDRNPQHIKSGGCWTAWQAKERKWVII